jgi:hypothetical protein
MMLTFRCTHTHSHLQVWKIEDFLAKWEGTCSTGTAGSGSSASMASDPGKAAIALVLLKEIDSYR